MATITPGDVTITVWRAGASGIALTQAGFADAGGVFRPNGDAACTSPEIHAQAAVRLRGTPGENVEFFRFGFIQLQFVEDNWAQYRGFSQTDGSMFFAIDRPPARPSQLCRDTYIAGQGGDFPILGPIIFYDGDTPISPLVPFAVRKTGYLPGGTIIPAAGTLNLIFEYWDSPDQHVELIRLNNSFAPGPDRVNFLYSLESSFAFATMFAVQKGLGQPIEVLRTFQWNTRWRAHFRPDIAGRVVPAPQRGDLTDMNVSHVVAGGPTEARFQRSMTDRTLPTCNVVVQTAVGNPVLRRSNKWEDWDVRHPV